LNLNLCCLFLSFTRETKIREGRDQSVVKKRMSCNKIPHPVSLFSLNVEFDGFEDRQRRLEAKLSRMKGDERVCSSKEKECRSSSKRD
jgi:hypothetical protein